jgi:hypothetical protein
MGHGTRGRPWRQRRRRTFSASAGLPFKAGRKPAVRSEMQIRTRAALGVGALCRYGALAGIVACGSADPLGDCGRGQAEVPIEFMAYGDESDPWPYPVPRDAPIEGGRTGDGDRHVLVVDTDTCRLYELYRAFPQSDASWQADSGAVFDLASNDEHPFSWTSVDAPSQHQGLDRARASSP